MTTRLHEIIKESSEREAFAIGFACRLALSELQKMPEGNLWTDIVVDTSLTLTELLNDQ